MKWLLQCGGTHEHLHRDTGVADQALWTGVAVLGAVSFAIVALNRGEAVNAAWLVVAAVCVYFIAYRFYGLFVANRALGVDAARPTPAQRHNDGLDYVPTNRYVLYGHHFAAIAGAGPLVGPVLAAQMGYLPGTLWILAGAVFAGAIQDMTVLFLSTRRDGRSLGDIVHAEMGPVAGTITGIGILLICVIVLAVLALVVVKALVGSPWGTFAVFCTIPIALLMGIYNQFIRPGHIGEMSLIGCVLLLAALVYGRTVAETPALAAYFDFKGETLALIIIAYGFVASVLPVWLLLAPRDYLSTFLKIGTIALLAVGIIIVRPDLQMPAVTKFIDGTGPVWSGGVFPFLFITIACGAVSGWHSLIASGTTPKMIENENQIAFIGYGGMLMESFVAIMAMIGASVIHPGVYFAMNSSAGVIGTTAEQAAQVISSLGVRRDAERTRADGQGRRRNDDHVAHRRRTDARGRHGEHPLLVPRRPDADGHLVSLRDPVRGAVHPDHGRCRNARAALHDSGSDRQCGARLQGDLVLDQQSDRVAAFGDAVGLLPLYRRDRSVRRNLDAVAAVRHRQPDARGDRADGVHGRAVQDETRALRAGDDCAGDMARRVHDNGRTGEGVQSGSERGFRQSRAQIRRRDRSRSAAGAGQNGGGDDPHRRQRLH